MGKTKKYELIIFDCDGTLVDSENIACSLITQMLEEIGIAINAEEVKTLFLGTKFADVRKFIIEKNGSLPEFDFEALYRKRSKVLFETELTPVQGVENILNRMNVKSCVASNAPHVKMDISIPTCKLDHYFSKERIFSAYDVKKWKPEPHLFLHACEKMGVAPDNAIIIEDSLPGILGAINAEIQVVAYNPHKNQKITNLDVPDFATMHEVENYLESFGILNV